MAKFGKKKTEEKEKKSMAEPPDRTDQRGASHRALPADDGGNGDHVVGIGCVTHTEEETEREQGKDRTQGGETG